MDGFSNAQNHKKTKKKVEVKEEEEEEEEVFSIVRLIFQNKDIYI